MPAAEIMQDFKEGTLHSGPGGPIVTKPKQAIAIKMSYLRKEHPHDRSLARSYKRAKHHAD